MADYWGKIDDYITFKCNTHDPDDGHAKAADSAPTYRIYEDETAVPILTGSLAQVDAGTAPELYTERIQLTAANGFEEGKTYTIRISAIVDGITATKSDNLSVKDIATETEIGAAVGDDVVEGAITLRQAIQSILAYVAGKTNGGGTATINFRNQADGKNRIQMTVDADGNRSAVSLDLD